MDHVVTIENEENDKKEENSFENSFDVIKSRYSYYSYDNKLTAHKPYDFFRSNSSKSNDAVSADSLPKEDACASDLKQTSHPSSKSSMEIIHGTIYTNNDISEISISSNSVEISISSNSVEISISSNSVEEHREFKKFDLPTYRSLSFCVMKDQPPTYHEVTGIKPHADEINIIQNAAQPTVSSNRNVANPGRRTCGSWNKHQRLLAFACILVFILTGVVIMMRVFG